MYVVWSMHCLICVKRPGFGNGFYAIFAAIAPEETSKTYICWDNKIYREKKYDFSLNID